MEINGNYISPLKGFWFVFNHENHEIKVGGSAFSGKEWVYVDGELQSETRNFKRKSSHKIIIEGKELTIEFLVTSMLKGEIETSLICGEKVIKKYKAVNTRKFFYRTFFIPLILGFAFCLVSGWYSWPYWYMTPLLPVIFSTVFFVNKKSIKVTEVHGPVG